jgi:hypothetical protein
LTTVSRIRAGNADRWVDLGCEAHVGVRSGVRLNADAKRDRRTDGRADGKQESVTAVAEVSGGIRNAAVVVEGMRRCRGVGHETP